MWLHTIKKESSYIPKKYINVKDCFQIGKDFLKINFNDTLELKQKYIKKPFLFHISSGWRIDGEESNYFLFELNKNYFHNINDENVNFIFLDEYAYFGQGKDYLFDITDKSLYVIQDYLSIKKSNEKQNLWDILEINKIDMNNVKLRTPENYKYAHTTFIDIQGGYLKNIQQDFEHYLGLFKINNFDIRKKTFDDIELIDNVKIDDKFPMEDFLKQKQEIIGPMDIGYTNHCFKNGFNLSCVYHDIKNNYYIIDGLFKSKKYLTKIETQSINKIYNNGEKELSFTPNLKQVYFVKDKIYLLYTFINLDYFFENEYIIDNKGNQHLAFKGLYNSNNNKYNSAFNTNFLGDLKNKIKIKNKKYSYYLYYNVDSKYSKIDRTLIDFMLLKVNLVESNRFGKITGYNSEILSLFDLTDKISFYQTFFGNILININNDSTSIGKIFDKNNFIGTTKLPAIIKDIPPRFSVKGGIETNTYGVYFDFDFVSNGNIYLTGIPQRSFFGINMDVFKDDSNKTCYGCILNMNGKDGVYSKDFIEEEVVHYK